jgi:hypothetical protein
MTRTMLREAVFKHRVVHGSRKSQHVRIKTMRALGSEALSADHSECPDENPAPGVSISASIPSIIKNGLEILNPTAIVSLMWRVFDFALQPFHKSPPHNRLEYRKELTRSPTQIGASPPNAIVPFYFIVKTAARRKKAGYSNGGSTSTGTCE